MSTEGFTLKTYEPPKNYSSVVWPPKKYSSVVWPPKKYSSEAEFLDVMGTKVFRVFLPAMDFTLPLPLEQQWFATGLKVNIV